VLAHQMLDFLEKPAAQEATTLHSLLRAAADILSSEECLASSETFRSLRRNSAYDAPVINSFLLFKSA
jgi:hypothetical protein